MLELEAWCYGLSQVREQILPGVVHRVIRDLAPTFRRAIEEHYVFDVHMVVDMLGDSSRDAVSHKEMIFSILGQLPSPMELNGEARHTFAKLIAPIEREYGGALARLKKKWQISKPLPLLKLCATE